MNPIDPMRDLLSVKRIARGQSVEQQDSVVIEAPLEIRLSHPLNDGGAAQRIAITMRTPGQDEVLGLGFLFTEGIIEAMEDVKNVELQQEASILTVFLKASAKRDWEGLNRKIYTSSSCGICGKADLDSIHQDPPYLPWSSSLKVSKSYIYNLPEQIHGNQSLFEQTGGAHATALFDSDGKMILVHEDVGRHNAMDKVIGNAMQSNFLPLDNHSLLVSGRASFELVQKAAMAGVPILCAVGAPSSLAVATAKEHGITLIGFLKKDRFNIYNGDRVQD